MLGRSYDAQLSTCGINITQLALLRCIDRRSGEPLTRIAEEMEMERTSLYRALAPMIREGWLVSMDGNDARSKTAKVTRKGLGVLAKANKSWKSIQRRVIGGFGDRAYAALLRELDRLSECGRAAGP